MGEPISSELQARVDALKTQGWTWISSPSADEAHSKSRITAPHTFEKYVGGRYYRAYGESLERALDAAEWDQARLEALDQSQIRVHTGLADTDNY